MSIDFEVVKNAIDNGDYGSLFSESIIWILFVFLTVILSFGSVIFYIVTCFCTRKDSSKSKLKIFFIIAICLFVLFTAFFFTLVGFIAEMESSSD